MRKKVLVTGSKGQLGSEITKVLSKNNFDVMPVDINDFDITDRNAVFNFISEYEFDFIIHCAAYISVDKAEEDRENCYNINVNGTKNLVDVALQKKAIFVYFNTDYIFNVKNDEEIIEEQEKNPLNYYGYTKSLAEDYVIKTLKNYFVFRISWIYGINGNNFVKTIIKFSKTKDEIKVVNDQIGSPTFSLDIAEKLIKFLNSNKYGIYNLSSEGFCSWYEFAKKIVEILDINTRIVPISSKEFNSKAKRPKNSRLSKRKLIEYGFEPIGHWEDSLKKYLEIYKNNM